MLPQDTVHASPRLAGLRRTQQNEGEVVGQVQERSVSLYDLP